MATVSVKNPRKRRVAIAGLAVNSRVDKCRSPDRLARPTSSQAGTRPGFDAPTLGRTIVVRIYHIRRAEGHDTRPPNAHGSLGNYLRQDSPSGLRSADAGEIGSCAQLIAASPKTLKPINSPALREGETAKQGTLHNVHQKSENDAPQSAPATTQKGRGANPRHGEDAGDRCVGNGGRRQANDSVETTK